MVLNGFCSDTHTHTHMLGFHVLRGCFLYCTNCIFCPPTLTLPLNLPITEHFQNTSLLIYKLFSSWGPKNVPTRTIISDIATLWGHFVSHNVRLTRTTHTHTQTHTYSGIMHVHYACFRHRVLWTFLMHYKWRRKRSDSQSSLQVSNAAHAIT